MNCPSKEGAHSRVLLLSWLNPKREYSRHVDNSGGTE